MLEIPNQMQATARAAASLVLAASFLTACATKEEPVLISDGRTGAESSLPWNKQERWEGEGQLGAMAERMNSR